MQFLKTSLKGDASRLIHHLNISEINYSTAWELLNNRYQNKRLLVATHLNSIFKLPRVCSSAKELKQMHDTTWESLRAISNLGVSTDTWGPIIVHILQHKMDQDTMKLYEQSLKAPKEVQVLDDFMEFLETRFQSLELMKDSKFKPEAISSKKDPLHAKTHFSSYNTCSYCKQKQHNIWSCIKFHKLPTEDKSKFVTKKKLCINCLIHGNDTKCKSKKKCGKCDKAHHTLLHPEDPISETAVSNISTRRDRIHKSTINNPVDVLLATALIKVQTYEGKWEYFRALIDPGSQTSFITDNAAQILGCPRQKTCVQVSGVGSTGAGTSTSKISVTMMPRFPANFKLCCELLVMKKLTSSLPAEPTEEIKAWDLKNCIVADPTYNIPGPIDLLIGADTFPHMAKEGMRRSSKGYLLQNTEFGWIISGKLTQSPSTGISTNLLISTAQEVADLTKFWELEEIHPHRRWTQDKVNCDEIFKKTTVKEANKYVVCLPLKEHRSCLGDSRKLAMARLLQLERKFDRDPSFHKQYVEFMKEYKELGHMKLATNARRNTVSYYIPHHAVMKEDSTTTKLRVVFDASAKSSTGKSLNDLMYAGPRIQENLAQILLRWRIHKIVLTADVEKMYRQIMVSEDDQPLQKILWRDSYDSPVQEFQLTTVTYGTTSAPYLAIRTLQQVATDQAVQCPEAARVVLNDFYVDDLITGCDSIEEAQLLQQQLIKLLQQGSFNLRKWKSNNLALIQSLPENLQDKYFLEFQENDTSKTLGVHWAPITDEFKFNVSITIDTNPTKRKILSQVAKLYDPLGWLAPVITTAKLLVQHLWTDNSAWDDPVSQRIQSTWIDFQTQLPAVRDVKVPRWIQYDKTAAQVQLHGFCDASEKAYGSVVYSRIVDKHGQIFVNLLQSKSKVAPTRMKKTLARLELCSAVLLSNLLKQVQEALQIGQIEMYAWSDSTITLAWIHGNPERWKTFVSNRVIEIKENTDINIWNHVISEENPADLVSRGLMPEQLADNTLWWNGPSWIHQEILPVPSQNFCTTDLEQKKNSTTFTTTVDEFPLTQQYSSINKLIRVVAYCQRFIRGCQKKKFSSQFLSAGDISTARTTVVRLVQHQHFPQELNALKVKKTVSNSSKLITLSPFLDTDGIIRVGGRLQNSALSFNEKHPVIVPHDDKLAELIIRDAHLQTLHGGHQLTHALIRQRYWIIKAKSLIRQQLKQCVNCFRANPLVGKQLMGNLPEQRVNMSPPFTHSGVDFAGPIQIRVSKGRGNKSYKGYIAIFVCMSTKAVHLEAVSDMTTEAFLAAFKRFQSRRGHCLHIYSDNGTNFIGAKGVLDKELQLSMKQPLFQQSLENVGTTWHFSPPSAPHFGGLWEAGVKSTKYHMKRIVGDNTLTFEELTTVLCQIEACLNSRPLGVVNTNPDDISVLTPGHLLTGRAILAQPDHVDLEESPKLSTRWKLLQKMKRDFWKVWTTEHLHRLQQRYKWNTSAPIVSVGDLVLIKDENTPSTRWPLARVTHLHSGKDNKTRVVTVKTHDGSLFKRPIVKICPLPICPPEESVSTPSSKAKPQPNTGGVVTAMSNNLSNS